LPFEQIGTIDYGLPTKEHKLPTMVYPDWYTILFQDKSAQLAHWKKKKVN